MIPKTMNYSVFTADKHYGFDYGGDESARFACLGDAYAWAKSFNARTGIVARVISRNGKTSKVEHNFEPAAENKAAKLRRMTGQARKQANYYGRPFRVFFGDGEFFLSEDGGTMVDRVDCPKSYREVCVVEPNNLALQV